MPEENEGKQEELEPVPLSEAEQFAIHGDDSSDDEDSAAAEYNVEKARQEYIAAARGIISTADPKGLSFFAQALGIVMLHRQSVNQIYYQKKKTLGENVLVNNPQFLPDWIITSLQNALKETLQYPEKTEIAQALLQAFFEQKEELIKQCVEHLSKQLRLLFKRQPSTKLATKLSKHLTSLIKELNAFIANFIANYQEADCIFTIAKLAKDNRIQIGAVVRIKEFLISLNLLNHDGNRLIPKKERNQIIEACCRDPQIPYIYKIVLRLLQKEDGRQSIDAILGAQREILSQYMLLPLFENVVNEVNLQPMIFCNRIFPQQSCQQLIINLGWVWNANPNLLASYFPLDQKAMTRTLQQNVEADFAMHFATWLQNEHGKFPFEIQRARLPDQKTFHSTSMAEYLALLRLSLREQKRLMRDEKQLPVKLQEGKKTQRAWQFGGLAFLALEQQEITSNSAKRDLVINAGNYEKIYLTLIAIQEACNTSLAQTEFKIDGKDMARWILNILQHQQSDILVDKENRPLPLSGLLKNKLLEFLVNLTYLIFGCEAIRNPASLVTQWIMVERIKAGKLTWKAALAKTERYTKDTIAHHTRQIRYGGGEMPMSMGSYKEENATPDEKEKTKKGEPVPAARSLQKAYGKFFPVPYLYPGSTLGASDEDVGRERELATREAYMVEQKIPEGQRLEESLGNLEREILNFFKV